MYERSGLHFLEIKDVIVQDAGSYKCLISNGSGTATACAELTVQGEAANQSRSAAARAHLSLFKTANQTLQFLCCPAEAVVSQPHVKTCLQPDVEQLVAVRRSERVTVWMLMMWTFSLSRVLPSLLQVLLTTRPGECCHVWMC